MKVSLERQRTVGEKVFMTISFLVLTLYALSLVCSFLWVFMNSLKTNSEFFDNYNALPKRWLFKNYLEAFSKIEYQNTNFLGMFRNSLILALENTMASIVSATITAYVLSKYKFRFCKWLYTLTLIMQTIPTIGSLTAQYQLVYSLKLNDNFATIWLLAAGGFSFNCLILYSGFNSISWTYAEAAQMDGAGHLTIFLRIMIPLAMPFITAVSFTTFVGQWNNYMTPFLYMDKMPNIALGLYEFQQKQVFETDMPPLFAGIVLSILPVLITYCFTQKRIIAGAMIGGIKG